MHNARALLATTVLTLVLFAGCLGGTEGDDTDTQGTKMEAMDLREPTLVFRADATEGVAPFVVNFTADVLLVAPAEESMAADTADDNTTDGSETMADNETLDEPAPVTGDPYTGNFAWTITFGDGDRVEGDHTTFPLAGTHQYNFSSGFSLELIVVLETNETLSDVLEIEVTEADVAPAAPAHDNFHMDVGGSLPLILPGDGPLSTCAIIQQADGDANNTFAAVWHVEVLAGAKTLYFEGGLDGGTVEDYDIAIMTADGSCTNSADEGSYEHHEVKHPAPGTALVGIVHWLGTPADEYTGFIEVRY